MGLYHGFVLLNKKDYPVNMKLKMILKSYEDIKCNTVWLEDDLLMYIRDTLLWMPCVSTRDDEPLNWYGITVIEQDRVSFFKAIIDAWTALFSLAPEEFKLPVGWVVNKKMEAGGYFEHLLFLKKDVLSALKAVSDMAEIVSKDNSVYILHLGI